MSENAVGYSLSRETRIPSEMDDFSRRKIRGDGPFVTVQYKTLLHRMLTELKRIMDT